MKKIVLVIASEGFQPVEYGEPKRVLEGAGVDVVTASDKTGEVTDKYDGTATADMLVKDIDVDAVDGVFFIGGPGALKHLDNETSYQVIREAKAKGKAFGAICISPRILAHAGVLNQKRITGWNEDGKLPEIVENGLGVYVDEPVVKDGLLVTAEGPDAAAAFGEAILEVL